MDKRTDQESPMNALDLCNACDMNAANPDSAAGYCDECEAEARAQTTEEETR